jgi:hypothetical protein
MQHPDSTELENVVGTFLDDGIGLMTEVSENTWEITLTPSDYYSIEADEEVYKIGMWFRDANNENEGMGFRNSVIYFNVESGLPFVSVDPPAFDANTEITVTFNARKGNQELVGADKVYMHSGVDLTDSQTPWVSGWNNVVGNWAEDDGVGQMSKVPGEDDLWEITFVPETYYGLESDDFVYWICAVFRNADGSVKGTGTPGEIDNGIIDDNLDFFIRNQGYFSVEELEENEILIYPNPTNGVVNLVGFAGEQQFRVFNIQGQIVFDSIVREGNQIDLSYLKKGIYFYRLSSADNSNSGKLVIF